MLQGNYGLCRQRPRSAHVCLKALESWVLAFPGSDLYVYSLFGLHSNPACRVSLCELEGHFVSRSLRSLALVLELLPPPSVLAPAQIGAELLAGGISLFFMVDLLT